VSGPDGLLRVTAVAGRRRRDLAVPDGVAVAELVPDLARAVGLLDPAAVYAGYRLHTRGRRLRPDQGLREQGVDDGALLAVTAVADVPRPDVHDDLADATAEVVRRQQSWRSVETRRTTLAAGLLAVAVGLGAAAWDRFQPVTAAVVLVLVTLGGNTLPAVAVALGVARADRVPVDPDRVATLVARSTRLLLIGSVVVGLTATVAVPVVADETAGVVLAVDCCVVLLLRARRHRALVQVLVDVSGGLAGLLAAGVAVLARHPDARPTVASVFVILGAATCALARLPAAPTLLRARFLDLLEILALVALAPLLLLATDGLARLPAI
jgi:hypothetical protein